MKLNLPNPPQLESKADDKEVGLYIWFSKLLDKFKRIVDNASLGFGDGIVTDNIAGTWYTYTTNAVANTEDTITHNLGVIPTGWLVVTRDKAGVLYKGGTAWTSTSMFLKCSVASTVVLLFILSPSNKGS